MNATWKDLSFPPNKTDDLNTRKKQDTHKQ